ncbi:flavin-containing monooxygenase [Nocardia seriolae]|uniref:flavin-containing monooxygenase n=1 Tax=Nocardia seriolae TaxID=37332 RepID=UPI0008FF2FE6|nr:NAD(P)/FAD-dependent oxidoreductase [Nocardia seriolae]MTJ61586.1 NAD(P)-binding protein [Nocardia seriolae]MTJ71553.1 NAD(P)-binding protein [Nocardia seriolae]MTJ86606.1 NAD(P)-binding protein [Nocardia seriolae]MTK30601.1 NAD(P)-binding protein [Nocardia seriolae]MTK39554.1 NAD(P)-binding protein [Nocardia seriolae]
MSSEPKTTGSRESRATHVDVLVVGAGLSGIGMGHYLKKLLPGKSFVLLDARDRIGGTWDLFRYPGIRSDSDLHTYAFEFKPWTRDYAIADGQEILDYLDEAVDEDALMPHIRFGHKVLSADFSTAQRRWTVRVQQVATGRVEEMTCQFLFSAAGYYSYEEGYAPHFEGQEDFAGQIVHPQFWPEDLDYRGRRVVVIGSGATAMTVVPAMAGDAAHVTMLQRSPTYAIPLPGKDYVAVALRKLLPDHTAYWATRRLNIARQRLIWEVSQRHPAVARRIIREVNKALLPRGFDVDVHFKPGYNPWDERLCAVRDGDLFKAIRQGKADVVTDHIDRFTEHGIALKSGKQLEADIIVTATGLKLLPFGGIQLSKDGTPIDVGETLAFKGMMLSGVPNFGYAIGYTNSSWTLKLDLVCEHLCRMLALMDERGYDTVEPVADRTVERRPMLDFHAGYVQRAAGALPKQGTSGPWTVTMTYASDLARLRKGPIDDPALRFGGASQPALAG